MPRGRAIKSKRQYRALWAKVGRGEIPARVVRKLVRESAPYQRLAGFGLPPAEHAMRAAQIYPGVKYERLMSELRAHHCDGSTFNNYSNTIATLAETEVEASYGPGPDSQGLMLDARHARQSLMEMMALTCKISRRND